MPLVHEGPRGAVRGEGGRKPLKQWKAKDAKPKEPGTRMWVRDCHEVTEVHPGLWLGGEYQSAELAKRAGILVPLAELDGDIWDTGWRGEVLYVPIADGRVLPDDVALDRAGRVAEAIQRGTSVGVFCWGGHGRTGYFAGLVLGLLGVQDPVALLREKYCKKAVETSAQIDALKRLLRVPEEIAAKWEPAGWSAGFGFGYADVLQRGTGGDALWKGLGERDIARCTACRTPLLQAEAERGNLCTDCEAVLRTGALCPECGGEGCFRCDGEGIVWAPAPEGKR